MHRKSSRRLVPWDLLLHHRRSPQQLRQLTHLELRQCLRQRRPALSLQARIQAPTILQLVGLLIIVVAMVA